MRALSLATKRVQEYFPDYTVLRGHISMYEVNLMLERDGHFVEFSCETYGDSEVYKMGEVANASYGSR